MLARLLLPNARNFLPSIIDFRHDDLQVEYRSASRIGESDGKVAPLLTYLQRDRLCTPTLCGRT